MPVLQIMFLARPRPNAVHRDTPSGGYLSLAKRSAGVRLGNAPARSLPSFDALLPHNLPSKCSRCSNGFPHWLSDRKRAEAGTFVGRWPDMPQSDEGRTFKSRSLFSMHEGAWTPDRVAQEIDRDPVVPAALA